MFGTLKCQCWSQVLVSNSFDNEYQPDQKHVLLLSKLITLMQIQRIDVLNVFPVIISDFLKSEKFLKHPCTRITQNPVTCDGRHYL